MITIKRAKKKPFMQELVMHFPVFSNYRVTVLIAEDIVSAGYYYADREYLKEPVVIPDTEAFTQSMPNAGYSTIHLKPNANLGTIAHEAYHAVTAMMQMIGAREEHEVVAYHLGYIVDRIVEFNLKVAPRFEKRRKLKCAPVKSADKKSPS